MALKWLSSLLDTSYEWVLWLLFSWKTWKKRKKILNLHFFYFNNRTVNRSINQSIKKYIRPLKWEISVCFFFHLSTKNWKINVFISILMNNTRKWFIFMHEFLSFTGFIFWTEYHMPSSYINTRNNLNQTHIVCSNYNPGQNIWHKVEIQ